jgi:vitamin B12 transporter
MSGMRLLTLLLLAPVLLPAQQADTMRLPDLVVTATRTEWGADKIPAATTVLHGDDLRARGVRFVGEALREVPGMMLVQTGSYGAVTSAFMRGGESDYVKVLVDGIPLNTPGGALNLADLSLDDIDRIEVVRGPASVLYGADAMSGVV